MRGSALLIGLLLTASLAGCAGGDGDTETDGTTRPSTSGVNTTGGQTTTSRTSGTGTTSGGPTGTGSGGANRPPSGTLSAQVDGSTVEFSMTGSDPDGDALRWTLAFGDGNETTGTALPGTVERAYPAGDFVATFTVSDGKAEVSFDANFTVATGVQSLALAGHVTTPDPWAATLNGCLTDAGRRDAGGPAGITGQDHPIAADQWGWDFALDQPGLIAEFWSEGDLLADSTGNSGTVPDEAITVIVCISDPGKANVDYQLTLTP